MKEITDDQLRDIVKSEYPYKGHVLDLRIDHVKFPSGKVKFAKLWNTNLLWPCSR